MRLMQLLRSRMWLDISKPAASQDHYLKGEEAPRCQSMNTVTVS